MQSRRGESGLGWALAGALLAGALFGVTAYKLIDPRPAVPVQSASVPELPRCLARRSKADRIAYWRQRTGLEPTEFPTAVFDASVTYSRDIAPLLFDHCAVCHRPGEVTPFSVLSYADVKPWAWLIGVVTSQGTMPPWPPGDRSDARFAGERLLDAEAVALIQRWLAEGAAEGDPADLPPPPQFAEGWTLGTPDLVVRLPEPYELPADGVDVYRNLVLPVPVDQVRWVRAVEIRPGNKRTVHHGVMQTDRFGAGRRLDSAEPGVGFGGMEMGSTENPGGHFIGWSPGKAPHQVAEDMAWKVAPGTDLVLQLHMLPSGRTETIDPLVGLYFTERPASREPFSLVLRNSQIDIAPEASGVVVEDAVTLPVDVQVLSIFPHAHYLATEAKAVAELPDGRELTLIHIDDWDFGWQDEYRYEQPLHLPAGTRVWMRFVYDNTSTNPRNPSQPPRRVVAGNSSLDEMAIMMMQVLSDAPNGAARVREAVMRSHLERNPDSWFTHNLLGASLRAQGKTDAAITHFLEAARLNPGYAGISYNLGNAFQAKGDLQRAVAHYLRALELQPAHGQVHNNLGNVYLRLRQLDAAEQHFRAQLALNPHNTETLFNLATTLSAQRNFEEAGDLFRQALSINPDFTAARVGLADLLRMQGDNERALEQYMAALESGAASPFAHLGAALAYLQVDDLQRALSHFESAARLDGSLVMALNDVAWNLATRPDVPATASANALAIAELADGITAQRSPEVLDTLAAAYAANAEFERAQQTMRKALELVGEDHAYSAGFRQRLSLYARGEVFVQPPAPGG